VPRAGDPDPWFAMVIARLINHIPTLEALGYPVPWDPEHFRKVMARRPKGGTYGSAYVIPAFKGGSGTKYIDQMHFILDPMWRQREKLRPRPGMACEEFSLGLQAFDNMGSGFLAAQVVADTKPFSALKDASDFLTFVRAGPGSEPGLNYVLGRDRDASWPKNGRQWARRLAELHALIQERCLPIADFQDLQNQLCEFHKYQDMVTGFRTRLKREYKPAVETLVKKAKKAAGAKPRGKKAPKVTPSPEPETLELPFAAPQPKPAAAAAPEPEAIPAYILNDAPPLAPEAPRAPSPKPAGKPRIRQIEFTAAAPLPAYSLKCRRAPPNIAMKPSRSTRRRHTASRSPMNGMSRASRSRTTCASSSEQPSVAANFLARAPYRFA
jgi:hypothetical protein